LKTFIEFRSTLNITNLNGEEFKWLGGFFSFKSCKNYVYDTNGRLIYIFDRNWNYLDFDIFEDDFEYIYTINDNIFIINNETIYKTNENFEWLNYYTEPEGGRNWHRGIYYNSSNNQIYVTANIRQEIKVFDLDLNLMDTIDISPNIPWQISGYNNQLYVGTINGKIVVIQNKVIIKTFNGCGGHSTVLTSIMVDLFGYMATVCNNRIFLFDSDQIDTGKRILTPEDPKNIGYDSKGQFIIVTDNQISIFS
jgi:DNA-binding beta-propeller fold protein YncE